MTIHLQPAPAATPFPGVAHATLACQAEGLEHLSIWRQSMDPGCCTPPHVHTCEEVVMCESGRGEIHIDGAVHAIGPRQTIVLPANVPHQIFAIGDDPLVTMAVFPMTPVPVTLPDGSALDLPWRT